MPTAPPWLSSDRARAFGGLCLGAVLLTGLLAVVGVDAIRRALATLPPRRGFSLLIVGAVPLLLWGLGLWLVLARLGYPLRLRDGVFLYATSGFLNAVTPFGQAGGDPAAAALFARAIDADFETGLAAIGSLNALNRVAAIGLGVLAVGVLGADATVAGTDLVATTTLTVALTIVVVLGLLAGWHVRATLVSATAAALAALARTLSSLPGLSAPSRTAFERRGRRFVAAIDRLAARPRRLALVTGLSVAGQLAVATTLWVALAALDARISLAVVLLLIPIAKLAGLLPTPGGIGSAEALLAGLLVTVADVTAPVAGAAALLYRASAFWLPSLVGAVATGWFLAVGSAGVRTRPSAASTAAPVAVGAVSRVLLSVAVALTVLVVLAVHGTHLLVEPDSIVVHTVRDAALALVSLLAAWVLLRRIPARWLE